MSASTVGNPNRTWIELVRVRSSPAALAEATPALERLVDEISAAGDRNEAFLMQHALYAGDLAVVLVWPWTELEPKKTREGLVLAERMERLGPVDHAVWIPARGGEPAERRER